MQVQHAWSLSWSDPAPSATSRSAGRQLLLERHGPQSCRGAGFDAGKVENWAFEAGTPNVLFRRGFTKNALLPGTKVNVDGYQSKDGSHRANGRDITLADGRKLFLGSSGTGAPYELPVGGQK